MGLRRHVNNWVDSGTSLSFDLVVRDEIDRHTYGGGRVTLSKSLTDVEARQALDDAVQAIVENGNTAFPRTKPSATVLTSSEQEGNLQVRVLNDHVRRQNIADFPRLGGR